MAIGVLQQRWPMMPSGIHPGTELSLPLREALTAHAGVPLMYHPVIEDGSYEDFKACVFRVCSVRACEVALEDMDQECREQGGIMRSQHRRWNYAPEHRCVTSIEIQMEVKRGSRLSHELEDFLSYLARKYGFVYNRVTINHQRERAEMAGYERGYHHESSLGVEMEIVWPYWT
jgi:hypothetical protein